ncbi:MAG: HepT-like ribonuclease domain-containing protein [Pseudomonadota bacterium]
MVPVPLDKETLVVRLNGIEGEMAELKRLAKTPFNDFKDSDPFKLAQYHLHRALEGVFNITAHILSRIPGGGQASSYKDMAIALGEHGIVDKNYANNKLRLMAGYRNRLVHFYAEITSEEMYKLINKDLEDFDVFLSGVKKVLEDPQKWNLEVE